MTSDIGPRSAHHRLNGAPAGNDCSRCGRENQLRRAPALIRWVKEVAPAEPLDDPVKGGGGVSVDGG